MEPAQAARTLADALDRPSFWMDRFDLIEGLVAVVPLLEPGEGARIRTRVASDLTKRADALTNDIAKPERLTVTGVRTVGENPRSVVYELVAVAAVMEPAQAARTLTDALARAKSSAVRQQLAEGLVAVAGRMNPVEGAEVAGRAARLLADILDKETDAQTYRGVVNDKANADARLSLAKNLAVAATRMEPGEAARVCAQATRTLANALVEPPSTGLRTPMAEGLAALATRMEPGEAAHTLLAVLVRTPHSAASRDLAEGLAAVAMRMEPRAAATVCARVARTLADELAKKPHASDCRNLAEGLVALAARMECAEAAEVCARAARALADVSRQTIGGSASQDLAEALAAVARRMEPREAASVCARVARTLADKLDHITALHSRRYLAEGLVALAARMEFAEAAEVYARAACVLVDSTVKAGPIDRSMLAEALAQLAAQMEPIEAAKICTHGVRTLTDVLTETTNNQVGPAIAKGLAALTIGLPLDARERLQHANVFAAGSFSTPHNILPSLPLLHPHSQPKPRPLPPQALIELLKHPFCVGEARRAVLDALEFTYSRKFKDQWDFVQFVEDNTILDPMTGKKLDLLSPPTRSGVKP